MAVVLIGPPFFLDGPLAAGHAVERKSSLSPFSASLALPRRNHREWDNRAVRRCGRILRACAGYSPSRGVQRFSSRALRYARARRIALARSSGTDRAIRRAAARSALWKIPD